MKTKLPLPKGFETLALVKEFRRKTINGLAKCEEVSNRPELVLGPCKKGKRCYSSLCPVCHRLLRKELVELVVEYELHRQNWSYLTVRINDWVMKAGDHRRFVDFMGSGKERIKDIPVFKRLLQRLRREYKALGGKGRLIVIGSVETVYRVVGNNPTDKPFHLHLIVSGLPKDVVSMVAADLFGSQPDVGPLHPVQIRTVKGTPEDFIKVMTYCVAQPFVKENFVDATSKKGRMQKPKPKEFAELACNLGQGKLSDRLLLIGMKIEFGKPKLISA